MNAKHTLFFVAAFAALPAQAAGERVALEQLPPPVRETLEVWRKGEPVKKIERRTENGRAFYLIEIDKNNAPNPHLRIAEDGTLVREPINAYVSSSDLPPVPSEYVDALPVSPPLRLSDLPAAVQRTAHGEARGREIVDIDRETLQGRLVYEIEFKERGPNSRVYVAEDGTVLRQDRRGDGLKSFFLGTQLEDTPPAVQETIRRLAGDREIADIDKKETTGTAVYRVEIRGPQGTQELRIAADGKVLYDSRAAKPDRGD